MKKRGGFKISSMMSRPRCAVDSTTTMISIITIVCAVSFCNLCDYGFHSPASRAPRTHKETFPKCNVKHVARRLALLAAATLHRDRLPEAVLKRTARATEQACQLS